MSLGMELQRNIREAWLRVRRKICSDADEIRRRLARRRSRALTRPPRAWCIAIRAADRRITAAHWVISPEHALDLDHPLHPYERIEHEVTIRRHAIRRFCTPVCFSREDAADVAEMLGASYGMIASARKQGIFKERFLSHLGGKPGKPVPLLSNGGKLLDPGAMKYERPHPIWGSMWEFLSREFPEDFEQTVVRKPYWRKKSEIRGQKSEIRGQRSGIRGQNSEEKPHPNPLPAYREREKDPLTPTLSPEYGGEGEEVRDLEEMQFMGWRWVCPGCGKEVRTIYYPIPVRTIFDTGEFRDPARRRKFCDVDLPQKPPATFACGKCHGVYFFSSISPGAWNEVISYLTAGMLYGCEVERPASFVPERRRTRIRVVNCEAPVRRKVLARLRNGWSSFQIARDLQLTVANVREHVRKICIEEDVADVHALAEKLKFASSPPLNYIERAAARRFAVKEMLLRDCSQREIMEALGIDHSTVVRDVNAIYKVHGIKGRPHGSRRRLAEKLGVEFVSKRDEVRKRVKEMGERGMSRLEIAREMGVSLCVVKRYRKELKRVRELVGEAAGSAVAGAV